MSITAPTFDDKRTQTIPCIVCGQTVQGSAKNPPCRDIATCRHRDGSVANKWQSWWSGRRGQPDSHEGGIE